MGWSALRWWRDRRDPVLGESSAHLRDFAASRTGVEAFVEPQTTVTGVTVVFVANDGEWTRRAAPDARAAHALANSLGVPSYDAAVVGYPARMREWSARRAAEERETERRRGQ
ncbi:hypothetical protein CLV35_2513 [Motilibacter peucedani]|uniref:Uncharacterized protein n=1 Tax=Motilibacter peucedani TaxID=598650 RepID=A0A420XPA5_9ACTN|nr:hypothetical protein [Motilibacter peucedani]RKS74015.1 hypothetical protein CLV35_2513 [Motilibacter peucedani]